MGCIVIHGEGDCRGELFDGGGKGIVDLVGSFAGGDSSHCGGWRRRERVGSF